MTREEAIKYGKEQLEIFGGMHRKFITMAIEALQAESVQGEWIVTEHCSNEYSFRKWIEIECPFCGEKPTYENLDNMNYCPNCGAKMKGQEE